MIQMTWYYFYTKNDSNEEIVNLLIINNTKFDIFNDQ